MNMKENTRLENNRKILKKLATYIETHADMRFGQILQALDINVKDSCEESCLKDTFFEEPEVTLSRMPKHII